MDSLNIQELTGRQVLAVIVVIIVLMVIMVIAGCGDFYGVDRTKNMQFFCSVRWAEKL